MGIVLIFSSVLFDGNFMVMIAFTDECLNNYASRTVGSHPGLSVFPTTESTDPARGLRKKG